MEFPRSGPILGPRLLPSQRLKRAGERGQACRCPGPVSDTRGNRASRLSPLPRQDSFLVSTAQRPPARARGQPWGQWAVMPGPGRVFRLHRTGRIDGLVGPRPNGTGPVSAPQPVGPCFGPAREARRTDSQKFPSRTMEPWSRWHGQGEIHGDFFARALFSLKEACKRTGLEEAGEGGRLWPLPGPDSTIFRRAGCFNDPATFPPFAAGHGRSRGRSTPFEACAFLRLIPPNPLEHFFRLPPVKGYTRAAARLLGSGAGPRKEGLLGRRSGPYGTEGPRWGWPF